MLVVSLLIAALLVGLTISKAIAQTTPGSVQVRLGSSSISIDETVTLSVTARDVEGQIDTRELESVFEVISRSQSSQISILNGKRSDVVTWALELVPREVGVFTVPVVRVGNVEGELLTLTVQEARTGADRQLFMETVLSNASPFVQEQTVFTVRVFQAINVLDGSLEPPRGDNLLIVPLEEDRVMLETRKGREFRVTEIRYAVFAQKSGALQIEPVTLLASVPADPSSVQTYLTPTRRLTRRTTAVGLDVRPRPAAAAGSWWLPASDVQLTESWSAGLDTVPVGTPLKRTIKLQATGVSETQLPPISVPTVPGLRLYRDGVEAERILSGEGVSAMQSTIWSILPERAGTLRLPAVEVDWFDTDTRTTRKARLPALTLQVVPGANPPPTDTSAAASSAPAIPLGDTSVQRPLDIETPSESPAQAPANAIGWQRWPKALPLTLALAGSSVLLLWLLRRRSRVAPGSKVRLRVSLAPTTALQRRLDRACREGDSVAAGAALLQWGAGAWPADPPRSLAALARQLRDQPLEQSGPVPGIHAVGQTLAAMDAERFSRHNARVDLQALPAQFEAAVQELRRHRLAASVAQGRLPTL